MFRLVQRLTRKTRPQDEPSPFSPVSSNTKRFDNLFGCEYMGKSEYEGDVISQHYRRMNQLDLSVREVILTREDLTRPVYFVASDDSQAYEHCFDNDWMDTNVMGFTALMYEFELWFAQEHVRSTWSTYFDVLFTGEKVKYPRETVAWWALRENIAWSLDETIANELLAAYSQPALAS